MTARYATMTDAEFAAEVAEITGITGGAVADYVHDEIERRHREIGRRASMVRRLAGRDQELHTAKHGFDAMALLHAVDSEATIAARDEYRVAVRAVYPAVTPRY